MGERRSGGEVRSKKRRRPKTKTRAIYTIYTDSGGALPAFVANSGSRIAIRKLFDAVRKQVKDPRYAVSTR